VFNTFPKHDVIAKSLEKYNIFSHVYAVDSAKLGNHTKFKAVENFIMPNRVVSKFMPRDISYDYYYSTSRSSYRASQIKVLWDRNPNMKRVMFDDGLGSYSDRGGLLRTSKLRSKAERILGWRLERPESMSFLAYMPELVNLPAPFDKCPVERMPKFELNEGNQRLLDDIFAIDQEKKIPEKSIIFDLPRRGDPYIDHVDDTQLALMDSFYTLVKKYAGDDVLCKPHPKSTVRTKADIRVYPYQDIPMEILYAGMDNLDDHVLISLVSSAVFTPKILFDAEPTVICLYKVFGVERTIQRFDGIFNKFRNTYRNKDKVLAPNTAEELKKELKRIYRT